MDKNKIQYSAHKIKQLYKNLTFFDQYGGSTIICIILITIVFWIHGYYTIMINVQPIKDNWIQNRCKPSVIPFAGFINKPDDKTATEFTQDNFTQCIQEMVKPLAKVAVNPFEYMTSAFLEVFHIIASAIENIRRMLNLIRERLAVIIKNIMGRILNFIVPLQQIVISLKDTLAKVVGIMQVSINTGITSIYAMKSLLGIIVTRAIQLILIGIAVLIVLIAIMVIAAFFAPPLYFATQVVVGVYTSFYMVMVGLLMFIIAFLQINLGIQQVGVIPGLPDVPRMCFDKNTPVLLADKTIKPFHDICLGDVLSDGGIVTAILQLDSRNMVMYDLHGIIVSGIHSVKYDNNWIYVSEHPESKRIENYREPYIYCMNTTTKQFILNGMTFIDWDEIYDREKAIFNNIYTKEYNVVASSLDYIHEYYDGGFEEDVEIELETGDRFPINKIRLGTRLIGDLFVYGIVLIDKKTIKNTGNIYKNPIIQPNSLAKKTDILYHLITNKGYFYVGGKIINDYNHYVDSRI